MESPEAHGQSCPALLENTPMPDLQPSGFMTVRQFLDTYPIGRTTLYRLAAAGQLSIVKIGRASRINRADAERWAASLPKLGG
jgi:excisionase family DNA binding protein